MLDRRPLERADTPDQSNALSHLPIAAITGSDGRSQARASPPSPIDFMVDRDALNQRVIDAVVQRSAEPTRWTG